MDPATTSVHTRLIVAVPGLRSMLAPWESFRAVVQATPAYASDRWLLHDTKLGPFSSQGLRHFAINLAAAIEMAVSFPHDPVDEIILLGHSVGGLLIRSAYLLATNPDYLTPGTGSWAKKVSRIVLFATPNRGVKIVGAPFILGTLGERALPVVRDTLRGSDFLTDLKIGWILHFRRAVANSVQDLPVIVQVLGTEDAWVSTEDSVDVEQLPNGDMYPLLPDTDHDHVHRWDWLPADQQQQRQDLLRYISFVWQPKPGETPSPSQDQIIQQVVFVLPGIRDANPDWAQQLATQLRTIPNTAVVVGNYGYFSAAKFLLPGVRRRRIGWFQDAYTGALLDYPNAQDFHVVGHSNGTYILGHSLERLGRMHFKRVYLAGSVLPETYNWNARLQQRQVQFVRNDMSGGDWPVGVLCRIMNVVLGMKDVGVGGFAGFNDFNRHSAQCGEYHYYDGDHGATIQSSNHASIKAFIQNGGGTPTMPMTGKVTPFVKRWNTHGPAVAGAVLVIFLLVFIVGIILCLTGHAVGWWLTGSVVALLGVIFYILDTV